MPFEVTQFQLLWLLCVDYLRGMFPLLISLISSHKAKFTRNLQQMNIK